ncbi:PD-(D/E)XK nuclease family protein [Aliarcobacter cryaerophilus]|uniref:PD-(D/E)XK nuclease family protein n=1 Tax=Aliarcobacter cryaerophilus TaxID=28198 RepID=UPI003DA3396C
MNIFKILSNGNGSIKEPSISAFLGYLLDPNREHGLKDYLLREIIRPLCLSNPEIWKKFQINENIVNLTNDSSFRVEVILEKKVKDNDKKDRFIDIVIKFFNKDNLNDPLGIVCIENKINSGSVSSNQLEKQFEGIKKDYPNTPLGFIYLTPMSQKALIEYEEFIKKHESVISYPLYWRDDSKEDDINKDVFSILVNILELESRGYIEPIFDYSKYTIKSFMNFIDTGFRSYVEEKELSNKKIRFKRIFREYIQDVHKNLQDDKKYTVKEIKSKIEELIKNENENVDSINQGTLNAQLIMHIINNRTRLHYNVNSTNHHTFDLFYYIDDSKEYIGKFNSSLDIEPIFKK